MRTGLATQAILALLGILLVFSAAFAQEKPQPVPMEARYAELEAAVGASRVVKVGEFDGAPGWGDLWLQRVRYRVIENGVLRVKDAVIAAEFKGLPEENAWWMESVPEPLREAPEVEAAPLGTDKEILTAVGGNIVKAEIERHPVVGDVAPSATVVGYREVDGKPVEFKVVVYSKGGTLVSNEPVKAVDSGQLTVDSGKTLEVVK